MNKLARKLVEGLPEESGEQTLWGARFGSDDAIFYMTAGSADEARSRFVAHMDQEMPGWQEDYEGDMDPISIWPLSRVGSGMWMET